MTDIALKNSDFTKIYNKSYRLAAAIFAISNVMDKDEDLKVRIKNLSLELVKLSVSLKDANFINGQNLLKEVEKNSLMLMSMLSIASVSGMISKMNGDVIRSEFESFISEVKDFADKLEGGKSVSVKNIFNPNNVLVEKFEQEEVVPQVQTVKGDHLLETDHSVDFKKGSNKENGHKRKDLRRNTILEFIKGHPNVSIKDIVPNIVGCSEKTIQRELINLINEGVVRKMGERRWSRYSTV